ncbi:hypothetical protein [Nocardia niigatensis]|uniref:hypothetical protein n=1 Tax=Nocardia niigatensis TaxID=209249 RepID=UPI0012F7057B|nr:hypothetical protein [Nocardia niigatensis]
MPGLALTIFAVAVLLNLVPTLVARFGASDAEGKVMRMIGSPWFGAVSSATALVFSGVMQSVIATAVPG